MKANEKGKESCEASEGKYISPNKLAKRWDCSRSSADRAAEQGNFHKFFLGSGTNGNIRYLIAEVEEFERKRTV